jgi:SAM-dependent methyltransferase
MSRLEPFLDVGCGVGNLVAALRGHGCEVQGIDIDATAVAMGQAAGRPLLAGPLDEQAFASGAFGTVVMNHTLEHVLDPLTVLQQVHRLLRPGGRLIVFVPNYRGLIARVMGPRWLFWIPEAHVWHFDRGTLDRLATRSGFATRSITSRGVLEPREGTSAIRTATKSLIAMVSPGLSCGDQLEAVFVRPPYQPAGPYQAV